MALANSGFARWLRETSEERRVPVLKVVENQLKRLPISTLKAENCFRQLAHTEVKVHLQCLLINEIKQEGQKGSCRFQQNHEKRRVEEKKERNCGLKRSNAQHQSDRKAGGEKKRREGDGHRDSSSSHQSNKKPRDEEKRREGDEHRGSSSSHQSDQKPRKEGASKDGAYCHKSSSHLSHKKPRKEERKKQVNSLHQGHKMLRREHDIKEENGGHRESFSSSHQSPKKPRLESEKHSNFRQHDSGDSKTSKNRIDDSPVKRTAGHSTKENMKPKGKKSEKTYSKCRPEKAKGSSSRKPSYSEELNQYTKDHDNKSKKRKFEDIVLAGSNVQNVCAMSKSSLQVNFTRDTPSLTPSEVDRSWEHLSMIPPHKAAAPHSASRSSLQVDFTRDTPSLTPSEVDRRWEHLSMIPPHKAVTPHSTSSSSLQVDFTRDTPSLTPSEVDRRWEHLSMIPPHKAAAPHSASRSSLQVDFTRDTPSLTPSEVDRRWEHLSMIPPHKASAPYSTSSSSLQVDFTRDTPSLTPSEVDRRWEHLSMIPPHKAAAPHSTSSSSLQVDFTRDTPSLTPSEVDRRWEHLSMIPPHKAAAPHSASRFSVQVDFTRDTPSLTPSEADWSSEDLSMSCPQSEAAPFCRYPSPEQTEVMTENVPLNRELVRRVKKENCSNEVQSPVNSETVIPLLNLIPIKKEPEANYKCQNSLVSELYCDEVVSSSEEREEGAPNIKEDSKTVEPLLNLVPKKNDNIVSPNIREDSKPVEPLLNLVPTTNAGDKQSIFKDSSKDEIITQITELVKRDAALKPVRNLIPEFQSDLNVEEQSLLPSMEKADKMSIVSSVMEENTEHKISNIVRKYENLTNFDPNIRELDTGAYKMKVFEEINSILKDCVFNKLSLCEIPIFKQNFHNFISKQVFSAKSIKDRTEQSRSRPSELETSATNVTVPVPTSNKNLNLNPQNVEDLITVLPLDHYFIDKNDNGCSSYVKDPATNLSSVETPADMPSYLTTAFKRAVGLLSSGGKESLYSLNEKITFIESFLNSVLEDDAQSCASVSTVARGKNLGECTDSLSLASVSTVFNSFKHPSTFKRKVQTPQPLASRSSQFVHCEHRRQGSTLIGLPREQGLNTSTEEVSSPRK